MKQMMVMAVVLSVVILGCERSEDDEAAATNTTGVGSSVVEESEETPPVIEQGTDSDPGPVVENGEGEPLPLDSMTLAEREEFLLAVWNVYYPTPNENWGHRFRPDYQYRYVDHSAEAKQARYFFTDGIWRIDGDLIQVQLTQYTMNDEEAVEVVPGFLEVPWDSGRTEFPIHDDSWHTIGTLESARVGIVLTDPYTDKLADFPPTIRLRPVFQDQVLDEEVRYWRYPL